MKLRNIAAGLLTAAALSVTSLSANATTGPFYRCIKTSIVNFDGTVVDAAVATPELSTLVSLVTAAGLGNALATTQNITVYAPTNSAFANIDPDVLSAIGGNTAALAAVLTYHVTPSLQDPRRYSEPEARSTLAGQQVFMFHDGRNARVNGSKVNCQGIKTSNGLVWLIDSVLLPQF
jgi:uncharacterized surface protein with fasciclin (FAS1) repeats